MPIVRVYYLLFSKDLKKRNKKGKFYKFLFITLSFDKNKNKLKKLNNKIKLKYLYKKYKKI